MNYRIQNIVASIADRMFLPVNVEYKDYFTIPLRVLILLFFTYSLIISFPPVVEYVKEGSIALPFISRLIDDLVFWNKWLPFINFVVEIVFFLMIGGSVFSEWVVSHSKETIQKYEIAVEEARKREVLVKKKVSLQKS